MGITIYTKGNLLLVLYVDDPAVVHTKVEKAVLGPKWPILLLTANTPRADTFLTSKGTQFCYLMEFC